MQPEVVALVLWEDEALTRVTVRVGPGGGQWRLRSVTFSDGDPIADRWTTVGLTVATLVGTTDASGHAATEAPRDAASVDEETPPRIRAIELAPTPSPPPRQEDQPKPPRDEVSPLAPHQRLVAVGALGGPGWDRGGARLGGWLSVGFRLQKAPLAFYGIGSYAAAAGPTVNDAEVSSRWVTGAVGAALVGTWQKLRVVGRGGLEVGYRRVVVTYQARDSSDDEALLNLRVSGSYPAQGVLAATVGGVLRLPPQSSGETENYLLRGPAVSTEVLAGLELRL
jgi:hypothetical protein